MAAVAAGSFDAGNKARPVVPVAGDEVLVKVRRGDPGGEQRVTLQVAHLRAVGLGDAHVTDQNRESRCAIIMGLIGLAALPRSVFPEVE